MCVLGWTSGAGFYLFSWDSRVIIFCMHLFTPQAHPIFVNLAFYLSLICMQPLTRAFKGGAHKHSHIYLRFKKELVELQLAPYWSVRIPDLTAQQSEIAVECCHVLRDERAVGLRKRMRKVRVPKYSSEEGAWEGFGTMTTGWQGRNEESKGVLERGTQRKGRFKQKNEKSMRRSVLLKRSFQIFVIFIVNICFSFFYFNSWK